MKYINLYTELCKNFTITFISVGVFSASTIFIVGPIELGVTGHFCGDRG